ncbi:MAG: flavodoxin family protein, partial [Thermodesulfobacteriota bacterium]
VNGNSEILLKEALMGAEEIGVESEIIRAMELRVKPCTGCEACSMAMARGKESRCAIKDDDVEWILEKVLVENCGLIVSTPLYHLRANSYFEIINERMLPTMFRNPQILKKTRVGGIICVGGGEPEWTPLGLTSANIFVQHTRKLVDQIQVNYVGRPGAVLARPKSGQSNDGTD